MAVAGVLDFTEFGENPPFFAKRRQPGKDSLQIEANSG
jgi:hypothetical protein